MFCVDDNSSGLKEYISFLTNYFTVIFLPLTHSDIKQKNVTLLYIDDIYLVAVKQTISHTYSPYICGRVVI